LFTLLALLISCMGMFGLAEFHTRRRIKEIGIRRVNGATVSEILLRLNWQFLVPVLIAFVIACPIGWYVMDRWLQRFAYRADMSWWIFALAGLVALTVALITVSWQSWRAATRNPVDSLHHE
jgi:putative ABC transport system permease protein